MCAKSAPRNSHTLRNIIIYLINNTQDDVWLGGWWEARWRYEERAPRHGEWLFCSIAPDSISSVYTFLLAFIEYKYKSKMCVFFAKTHPRTGSSKEEYDLESWFQYRIYPKLNNTPWLEAESFLLSLSYAEEYNMVWWIINGKHIYMYIYYIYLLETALERMKYVDLRQLKELAISNWFWKTHFA